MLKLVMQQFLLCNSIGHGQGLDRGFGCLNVLSPPTRDDFWPGYKAGTHSFILAFPRWMTLRSYIPPPPLVLPALFPWGILFSSFGVFVPSPLLGSTHFIQQLFFVINSRKFEWLNRLWAFALSHFTPSGMVCFYSSAQLKSAGMQPTSLQVPSLGEGRKA